MVRNKFRKILSSVAGYLELLVAAMIVLAVALASVALFSDLLTYGNNLFDKEKAAILYNAIFSTAIYIVIGVEMIKMIVKHTPASVLEVLLFVISKRVVAETEFGSVDMLLCVLAIAVIFAIKKFLHYDTYSTKDGMTFPGNTKLHDIEDLMNINLPSSIGETIGEVVVGELHRLERRIAIGETVNLSDALCRIHSMEDGEIKKIEVVKKKR